MYIKEVFSMYLSLDLIMKAGEPMVFCDHLIFSLVFSKLQGSSQNDNAQIRTGTSRKIGIMIICILFSIVKFYCLCCCKVLGPQLFFDFMLGLEKKKVSESLNVVILRSWLPTTGKNASESLSKMGTSESVNKWI